ncbi:MAG: Uma2 family endonuclease [Gemmatimonadetes bacterium]|nr:Uma2 family endonuclease [Gemmatimonadota bacterium]
MSTLELRYDWDYSDYARLPDDGNHYEVLDGELLVTPSPSPLHQVVSFRLAMLLGPYVEGHRLGLMIQDVDLLFQTGQFLRPDLLVVEILPPTSGPIDLVKKPARYGDFGIPEYWVLDPEDRCAWVWHFAEGSTAPEQVRGRLEWPARGASEPLRIDLEELLRPL